MQKQKGFTRHQFSSGSHGLSLVPSRKSGAACPPYSDGRRGFTQTPISQKGSAGFTLIELLVVIAIIGFLSSIVIVNVNSARMKARDARRLADFDNIRTALLTYRNTQSADRFPLRTNTGCFSPVESESFRKDSAYPAGSGPFISELGPATAGIFKNATPIDPSCDKGANCGCDYAITGYMYGRYAGSICSESYPGFFVFLGVDLEAYGPGNPHPRNPKLGFSCSGPNVNAVGVTAGLFTDYWIGIWE